MKLYLMTAAAGAAALGGCATTTAQNHVCNADPAQLFVGQKADAGPASPSARRPARAWSAGVRRARR